jgi:hypothetical protein
MDLHCRSKTVSSKYFAFSGVILGLDEQSFSSFASLSFRDLELVLKNGYRLRNTPYGVNEQFPPEIENRRRRLYPIMKQARLENKQVRLENKQVTLVRDNF